MDVFKMFAKDRLSIHLNLCGDKNQKLMTEILEAVRWSRYNNFSFHVVSKYQEDIYPVLANMIINAYASENSEKLIK